jgi:hypothetical protein
MLQDGFVAFRRGELLCGNLGKKTLGGDSKSGLFYVLIRDFGALQATQCMTRLSKLCARFLGDRGFSIGVDDVTPSLGMRTIKTRIVADGQRLAQEQITAYKSGKIRLKPGCDALQVPVVITCPAHTQLQSVPILAPLLARVQPQSSFSPTHLTPCDHLLAVFGERGERFAGQSA